MGGGGKFLIIVFALSGVMDITRNEDNGEGAAVLAIMALACLVSLKVTEGLLSI